MGAYYCTCCGHFVCLGCKYYGYISLEEVLGEAADPGLVIVVAGNVAADGVVNGKGKEMGMREIKVILGGGGGGGGMV